MEKTEKDALTWELNLISLWLETQGHSLRIDHVIRPESRRECLLVIVRGNTLSY